MKKEKTKLAMLVGLGIILVLTSFWSLRFSQPDFVVAADRIWATPEMELWTFVVLFFYAALWIYLKWLKTFSWKPFLVAAMIFYVISAAVSVAVHPTQSQDLYWNLALVRGWNQQNLNPYSTFPHELPKDEWLLPVSKWQDQSMTHGPIWVLFLSAVIRVGKSLGASLILVKSVFVLMSLLAGLLWWKILDWHNVAHETRTKLIILAAWSPFVIQNLAVDGHNDIFVLVAVLASYYFLITRRYFFSIAMLLLGGFVKYTPWFLIPIPLVASWLEQTRLIERAGIVVKSAFVFIILGFLLYWPLGFNWHSVQGLSTELAAKRIPDYQLVGTFLVSHLFHANSAVLRGLGLSLGTGLLAWFIYRRKVLEAYTIPYLAIFFFATPWFVPWYMFWIYPLVGILLPLDIFAFLNAALFIMPPATPLVGSLILLCIISSYFLVKKLLSTLKK